MYMYMYKYVRCAADIIDAAQQKVSIEALFREIAISLMGVF